MKYISDFNYFIIEKSNNSKDELVSFFSDILILTEQNLSTDKSNFDKGKLEKLLKYSNTQKSKSALYIFIYDFIKSLINSIDSNNNKYISELISNDPKITFYINYVNKDKGREKSPYNYIKTVINLLEQENITNKISQLENKYKQILKKSSFAKRTGTQYYDPEHDWYNNDNTHQPVASHEDVIETLFKYYKPGYSLLDIGAGYGNIMRISEIIGYKVKGIELKDTKKYTKGLDIIYDDFFNVSSDIISEFDVIYFYRPFTDSHDMDILLKKLDSDCKTGAIIIYNYPHPNLDKNKLENEFENFKYIENIFIEGSIIVFKKV
jgi:2-polyprenyl-3-methyl-5-hydroxy-6-metoxy-1,4-benzoquinol methylase